MASRCVDTFVISLVAQLDADIELQDTVVSASSAPNKWNWVVTFTYVTGMPPATAFRLNSADGLSGVFLPPKPEGEGAEIRNASLSGIVTTVVDPIPEEGIPYSGRVTIIQA